jgi:hypothetical protein
MTRYSLKFASLLRILRLEADPDLANSFEFFNGGDSHSRYRSAKVQYLKNALAELRQEYEALYAAALPIAVKDRDLGRLLAEVEQAYRKSTRQIKTAIMLTRFLPSKDTSVGVLVNKVLLALPRFDSAASLLTLMEKISVHLEHA